METRSGENVLLRYMTLAPCALAFERYLECRMHGRVPHRRPVLDLGCGDGLFAQLALGAPVDTGVDPNMRDLARARERRVYRELIQCRADAVPKPDGAYRTILANSVLEHIPALEPVLAEAYRLLAPGGRLYASVPSKRFSQYTAGHALLTGLGLRGMARTWRRLYDAFWRHYHAYAEDEWISRGRRYGFELLECRPYAPREVCLLNDLLVPLALPALVWRRLFDRWTLWPGLRRVALYPLYLLARRVLSRADQAPLGGLVFLAFAKPGDAV